MFRCAQPILGAEVFNRSGIVMLTNSHCMLSTDMIRVTTRLAEGMGTAWISKFQPKEEILLQICCRSSKER
jgi:hypothetical protein